MKCNYPITDLVRKDFSVWRKCKKCKLIMSENRVIVAEQYESKRRWKFIEYDKNLGRVFSGDV